MNNIRIAIGATLHKRVHKNATGGTEIFAYELVEALVKRNYDVTLSCSSDSEVNAKIIGDATESQINEVKQGQRLFFGYQLQESMNLAIDEKKFDVIHVNYYEPYFFLPFSRFISKPVLYTIHSDIFDAEEWQLIANKLSKPQDKFIFVSKSACDRASLIQNKGYIYNGINVELFPFSRQKGSHYLWLGRIRKKKGVKEAAEFGVRTGFDTVISGVIDNPEEKLFYEREVLPLVNNSPKIKNVGPSDFNAKINYYKNASALLVPISWEEPFGLTIVEAMACGTPVIAYNRGAVPEIIQDGLTGFIIDPDDADRPGKGSWIVKKQGVEGLIEAAGLIDSIDRSMCRKLVEERFALNLMVDNYVQEYQKITRSNL